LKSILVEVLLIRIRDTIDQLHWLSSGIQYAFQNLPRRAGMVIYAAKPAAYAAATIARDGVPRR